MDPRCQGWLQQPQHHLPGRSQLISNPQLSDLSRQSGRAGHKEELPQLAWEPWFTLPPATLHGLAQMALLPEKNLSPLQEPGGVMAMCQGKSRPYSRSASHRHWPQLGRLCGWSQGGRVGCRGRGGVLLGCRVSVGLRSARSSPKSHAYPPSPKGMLAQVPGLGRNSKQAARGASQEPLPCLKGEPATQLL